MTLKGVTASLALIAIYGVLLVAYFKTRRWWRAQGAHDLFTWLHFRKHWWNS